MEKGDNLAALNRKGGIAWMTKRQLGTGLAQLFIDLKELHQEHGFNDDPEDRVCTKIKECLERLEFQNSKQSYVSSHWNPSMRNILKDYHAWNDSPKDNTGARARTEQLKKLQRRRRRQFTSLSASTQMELLAEFDRSFVENALEAFRSLAKLYPGKFPNLHRHLVLRTTN